MLPRIGRREPAHQHRPDGCPRQASRQHEQAIVEPAQAWHRLKDVQSRSLQQERSPKVRIPQFLRDRDGHQR
jgi:hypothetical protein